VAAWYAYPLVGRVQTAHVHLAPARPFDEDHGDDRDDLNAVSVIVTGADSADLRLRIDTLMDAPAAWPRRGACPARHVRRANPPAVVDGLLPRNRGTRTL
jgi:hypothetical protein